MKVVWDQVGERLYQTGVDRGVLYPPSGIGVAWNGLTSVNETPSGGDPKTYFIDGYMYGHRAAMENFQGTIEAFTYPKEFEICDGTLTLARGLQFNQQRRRPFGMSYRTLLGNDLDGTSYGYRLHLIYNVLASPTSRENQSISDNPEALGFSWSITSKPVRVAGYHPVPHITIESVETMPSLLAAVEDILYGSETDNPRLISPADLATLFEGWPEMVVIDNGDGTFTVDGPDNMVALLNSTTYQINSLTATPQGDGPFTVSSS